MVVSSQATSKPMETYYPEFGENVAIPRAPHWAKVAALVVAVVGVVFVVAAVGFAIGNVAGLAIGVTSCVVGLSVTFLAKDIYDKVVARRFLSELPVTGQHPVYSEDSHKVGKYTEANVRIAETADEAFQWKKKLIVSAEVSIELSPNFAGGSYFQEVLQIIELRMEQKEELKSHLLLSADLLTQKDLDYLKILQSKFKQRFECLITQRNYSVGLETHTEENHVKMLVVDGKYFASGGSGMHARLARENHNAPEEATDENMAARLLAQSSRDMDLIGESAVLAQTMRKQFFNLFRIYEIRATNKIVDNRYFTLSGAGGVCEEFVARDGLFENARVKFLVGGPEHAGNNSIEKMYVKRVLKAKTDIRLANLKFTPQPELTAALWQSKRMGKRIVAYLNGNCGDSLSSQQVHTLPARGHYSLVNTAYEYNVAGQQYHKKVATFDDRHTIIGSYNLGKKSAEFDHEVAFVIKDKRITERMHQILDEDASRSIVTTTNQSVFGSFWNRIVTLLTEQMTENFI